MGKGTSFPDVYRVLDNMLPGSSERQVKKVLEKEGEMKAPSLWKCVDDTTVSETILKRGNKLRAPGNV